MATAKRSDWKNTPLPRSRVALRLARSFSAQEMEPIRRGVVPEDMADKWFIYFEAGTLYFHRSWTGICIYAVRFEPEGDGQRMVEAQVNRDRSEYGEANDELDARMIPYLIDTLLLRREAEFPSEGASPEEAALRAWSQVGRASVGEFPKDE